MKYNIYSPLDQFEILVYNFVNCSHENFFINSLFCFCLIFCATFFLSNKKFGFMRNPVKCWQTFYKKNMPKATFTRFGNFYLLIFITILTNNVLGLFPYVLTLTSHVAVTLSISFITMSFLWLSAFMKFKVHFLNHFIPAGTPFLIIPFMIFIEIVSHLSRIISLAVRLFANMTSGHALLKIFANFSYVSIMSPVYVVKALAVIPFIVVILVTNLEILIAFLQAYVFIFLIFFYNFEYNEAH